MSIPNSPTSPERYEGSSSPRPAHRRLSIFNENTINSMEHFAHSYSRAQTFLSIEPPSELNRHRAFFDDEGSPVLSPSPGPRFPPSIDDQVIDEEYDSYDTGGSSEQPLLTSPHSIYDSFKSSPHLNAPEPRRRRLSSYTVEPIIGSHLLNESEAISAGTEQDPVIVRKIEDEDGHITTLIAGQSTVPQTIFNSVNVLIGVGLLALPLGFKYAGWIIGTIMMIISALSTYYSAILLAKCLDTDNTIVTYADVAYVAFGAKARALVSLLFTVELLGAGVSLIILFSDSLHSLIPSIGKLEWKFVAFVILTPPCFLPLRILSFSSILGIITTFALVLIVLFDGFYKTESPGSLLSPEVTWLWPQKWSLVPMSIGIFMSPWGGHAIFPNIYRDMRHPQKYESCLKSTYSITFLVDMSMGVLGFLMFGGYLMDEVTKNILLTPGYPPSLSYVVTCLIATVPLAKTPLMARPIVSTLDVLLGLDRVEIHDKESHHFGARFAKLFIRVGVVGSFVGISVIFPDFDRIIAFVGSLLVVTICMILPLLFYLRLYYDRMSKSEMILDYFLLIFFTILAIVGTIWCMLPAEVIGKD